MLARHTSPDRYPTCATRSRNTRSIPIAASSFAAARLFAETPTRTMRIRTTYLEIDPAMCIAKICGFCPLRREADRQRLIEGLRRAGVPE
jgi:hypothetical protein